MLTAQADSLQRSAQVLREEGETAQATALTACGLGLSYRTGVLERIMQAHYDHGHMLSADQAFSPDALAHHLAGCVVEAVQHGRVAVDHVGLLLKAHLGWCDMTTVDKLSARLAAVPDVRFQSLLSAVVADSAAQSILTQVLHAAADLHRPALEEGARHRTQFDPLITAIASVRRGQARVTSTLSCALEAYRATDMWGGLARGLDLILAGRDTEALGVAADGADEALIARCLNVVRGTIELPPATAQAVPVGGILSLALDAMQHPGTPTDALDAALALLEDNTHWAPLRPHLRRMAGGDPRRIVPPGTAPHIRAALELLIAGARTL